MDGQTAKTNPYFAFSLVVIIMHYDASAADVLLSWSERDLVVVIYYAYQRRRSCMHTTNSVFIVIGF